MTTKILASLYVLFFLCTCKSPSDPYDHDFTVVGTVTDGNNGMGIAGAEIVLRRKDLGESPYMGASTWTDLQGRYTYRFKNKDTQRYLICARKEDYKVLCHGFENTTRTQTIDFRLSPESLKISFQAYVLARH